MKQLVQRIGALQPHKEGDILISTIYQHVDELGVRDRHSKYQTKGARRQQFAPSAGRRPLPTSVASPLLSANDAGRPTIPAAAIPAVRPPEPMGSHYSGEG
jgi:hypothetical protein